MRIFKKSGQSIVEYVVLLALVAIVAISIVAGVGYRSKDRYTQVNDTISEAAVASGTGRGTGRPPIGTAGGGRGNGNGGRSNPRP